MGPYRMFQPHIRRLTTRVLKDGHNHALKRIVRHAARQLN
jgi:hypothetical protein